MTQTLALSAFIMGLLGGVHCIGMCGGLVGAMSLASPRAVPLAAYNAGRLASYAAAGGFAGALGGASLAAAAWLPAQTLLFVLANAAVILIGLSMAGWGTMALHIESAGAWLWRGVQPLGRRLLPASTPFRAVAVGLLWGWVPCGLVYSALALALASGDAAQGALVMLCFGAGTLPNLFAAGFAAHRMRGLLRERKVRIAAGLSLIALALVGVARVPGLWQGIGDALLCLG